VEPTTATGTTGTTENGTTEPTKPTPCRDNAAQLTKAYEDALIEYKNDTELLKYIEPPQLPKCTCTGQFKPVKCNEYECWCLDNNNVQISQDKQSIESSCVNDEL